MADIVDNEELDKDTVDPATLEQQFTRKYKLVAEKSVSLKKSYINSLCATKSLQVAVSQSDHSIEVYQLKNEAFCRVCRLSGHPKGLTEVVASPVDEQLIYSSGVDGVKVWDLRKGGSCVQEYNDKESRAVDCVSVSCTGRVVCGGTALIQEDAFLLFWDARRPDPLGGYWHSHSDDITQVGFHPEAPSTLWSGSTDGCVNVYDISQGTEDEALTYSIPVEAAVERLSWLGGGRLGAVTACQQCRVCDVSTGDVTHSYDRHRVAKGVRRSKSSECYLVDTFATADGAHVLLAGSYADDGAVLRCVSLSERRLQPYASFAGNTQIVRCCYYHQHSDTLVTAGEGGAVCAWRLTRDPNGHSHA